MKHHLPSDMKWTSFAINSGTAMPTHRDVQQPRHVPQRKYRVGRVSGGEIWVEGLESVGAGQAR